MVCILPFESEVLLQARGRHFNEDDSEVYIALKQNLIVEFYFNVRKGTRVEVLNRRIKLFIAGSKRECILHYSIPFFKHFHTALYSALFACPFLNVILKLKQALSML